MYVETEKNVYYPGELVNGCIHLMLTEEVSGLDILQIRVKGKESFKFKSDSKQETSKRDSRVFYDNP